MSPISRRELLRAGAAGGAALAASTFAFDSLIGRALAASTPCHGATLDDIEHIVIFMQENRSFDHYFGTYRGVRGFRDPGVLRLGDGSGLTIYAQPGYPGGYDGDHLYPFHFNSYANGECTNDIDHEWGPQHAYWDGGKLDGFVTGHLKVDGPGNGPLTMGYYERSDLQFYYALADAFTLCDGYHCSVIGPTDPNRLYCMSAWIDPAGTHGGPILSTSESRVERYGTLSWTTMPEQLEARGISWKVYGSADGNFGDNVLPYFKQYSNPALASKALTPSYPGTFQTDVAAGTLPQVSWILAPLVESEHPPGPTEFGESVSADILNTLVSNPAIWEKTAFLITFDENGGFFDHVPPPVAPRGTAGEYLTVNPLPADADGVAGPIGLGFRVPLLVVSPLSRGGFVCSDVFDHTSLLRLLETRFGAEVPNLSSWRRSITGDLTTAFNFAKLDTSVPSLPQPSLTDPRITTSSCALGAPLDLASPSNTTLDQLEATVVPPYPVTVNSGPPAQEAGTAPAPSGLLCGPGATAAKLSARGVTARSHETFHGTIATFSYTDTRVPVSAFRASITWPGGEVTHGKLHGSGGSFRVQARHRFAKVGRHRVRVKITAPNGAAVSVHSFITVVHTPASPRPTISAPSFTG